MGKRAPTGGRQPLEPVQVPGGWRVQVDGRAASVGCMRRRWVRLAVIRRGDAVSAKGYGLANVDFVEANAFDYLREREAARDRFETIVLDPPAFAKSRAALPGALRGYKDINLRALRLLNPGGYLVTCSCSYNVDEATFAQVIYEASVDSDVHVTVVDRRHAAGGHWRDAYPFVQLHQASVFYGVASTVLGGGTVQAAFVVSDHDGLRKALADVEAWRPSEVDVSIRNKSP